MNEEMWQGLVSMKDERIAQLEEELKQSNEKLSLALGFVRNVCQFPETRYGWRDVPRELIANDDFGEAVLANLQNNNNNTSAPPADNNVAVATTTKPPAGKKHPQIYRWDEEKKSYVPEEPSLALESETHKKPLARKKRPPADESTPKKPRGRPPLNSYWDDDKGCYMRKDGGGEVPKPKKKIKTTPTKPLFKLNKTPGKIPQPRGRPKKGHLWDSNKGVWVKVYSGTIGENEQSVQQSSSSFAVNTELHATNNTIGETSNNPSQLNATASVAVAPNLQDEEKHEDSHTNHSIAIMDDVIDLVPDEVHV